MPLDKCGAGLLEFDDVNAAVSAHEKNVVLVEGKQVT